jgi:DGQHR domain-containing protein
MDVNKTRYTDADEANILCKILSKAGIDNVAGIGIPAAHGQFSEVDVIGVYANIVILVMCCGRETLGRKMRFDEANFRLATERFPELLPNIRAKDGEFVRRHEGVLVRGKNRKFVKLLVHCKKESLDEVLPDELEFCTSGQMFLWTREQFFYFDWISDSTYDHCRYEILSALGIRPSELVEENRPAHVLVYLGYGNRVDPNTYLLNFVLSVEELMRMSSTKRLRDASQLGGYQRLLKKAKLMEMRQYLLDKVAAWPNNIVCVLSPSATVTEAGSGELDFGRGNAINVSLSGVRNRLFVVELPDAYDNFEIVDGQHRLYAFTQSKYHLYETIRDKTPDQVAEEDNRIESLARAAYLPVTAIYSRTGVGPWGEPGMLFLDINTKQTRISPEDEIDLSEKYGIDPLVGSANYLVRKLNEAGALQNRIKVKFWQTQRIQRTSLIKYSGLKTLFDSKKQTYKAYHSLFDQQSIITDYRDYCYVLLNNFFFSMFSEARRKQSIRRAFSSRTIGTDRFYLLSAVYVGAMIRLFAHFISSKNRSFRIREQLNGMLVNPGAGDGVGPNVNNPALQSLFSRGLRQITTNYNFTQAEFESQESWGPNRWAKIEADLFYAIRSRYHVFGNVKRIRKKYRRH